MPFAQLLLGEPSDVAARATLSEEKVDLRTGALPSWDDGALASVHCSAVGGTETSASITGSKGRIDIPCDSFFPDGFVLHRECREAEKFTASRRTGAATRSATRPPR